MDEASGFQMQTTGAQHPDLPATKISREHGRSSAATSEKVRFSFSVFISFRGEDTRNGFTSHLHKEFDSRGIKTFIDSEDLEKGTRIDYLLNCIEESKIFVPVFSKAYADSKWCLKEITKIVEINKREGEKRPIVPIFYDVNPSDVKHCQASFEKAFEEHRRNKKLGEEQIDEWKTALAEAGSIVGYCPSQTEGNEAKLVTVIAAQISKILSKVPFDIQPIGIDSHINVLKQKLGRENDGNCMIGIHGLGGIGKTTIAMAIYNELSPTFELCCFLHDIRENEKREGGLPKLQAKLMKLVDIENVREGVTLMKGRLGNKKVLLILDDVDHTRQLEAFIADRRRNEAWFGAGSKIIVTTRNKEVLLGHGLEEDEIYMPQVLDPDQSLQLFFHHAFISDQLLAQVGNLPQEIVKVAAGLPLALVVFGSHFSLLKEKYEWENGLKRLKAEQHKEVHEKLRISYDSLNDREQLVFLDIACLFIGHTKKYLIYMWEACGCCFPEDTLKVLQHKSLIKINKRDEFEMHDQIRDMGRMVVEEEGKRDPLKYSRPWSKDQILKVLEDAEISQGNPHLQCLDLSYIHFPKFGWKAIAAMPELRMMICWSPYNTSRSKKVLYLPKKLKWFSWQYCRHRTLTFHNNRHEQLRILDLSCGLFRDLGTHGMVFPQLKVLDLFFCRNLIRTPDFTHLPSLELLNLHGCYSLVEVDESIGHLKNLVTLHLSNCHRLKGLPTALCKLTSLEFLDISHCSPISGLPDDIGNMKSLKHLDIGFMSISHLPDSLGRLQSLEFFRMCCCRQISSFPEEIVNMKSLKHLDSRWTPISDLPNSIGRLQSLEFFDISVCGQISSLPEEIGNIKSLKRLNLGWTSISHLPNSIGRLQSLEFFDMSKCNQISSLPEEIGNMKSLKHLDIRGTSISHLPESIGRLQSLEFFDISRCDQISSFPEEIVNMKSLKHLDIRGTPISHLPNSIGRLQSLEFFDMSDCHQISSLPEEIGNMKSLKRLNLKGTSISHLPESIRRLQSLEIVDLLGRSSVVPTEPARLDTTTGRLT